ncbi:hypothetical protein [Streptomyces sp. NBC_00059]|uniref:hypothetical protein n=1 Tax=Streptomyces sp. NBC_00059 TaxID=2975635 RepID=UPI00225AE138|nr:hypothetical protein [Streptomyces sp. NBC_00059]MCX5414887.1 hypothetical protein [Streptomyces sp. NBC_00059]
MSSMMPARVLLLVTSGTACLATAASALVGLFVEGPLTALILGIGTATGSIIGAFLVRRRAMAAHARARAAVMAHGYAEGIAQYVLLIVCNYEAAVFPRSGPHGVTPEERAARRADAYRIAAEEEVPHQVREAAAHVLAALDDGDHSRSVAAQAALIIAVHAHAKQLVPLPPGR